MLRERANAINSEEIMKSMKQKPFICTSITQTEKASILGDLDTAKREGSDLAELRIDFMTDKKLDTIKSIISESPLPLIITNRNKEDGGKMSAENENERLRLLNSCIELKPAFVDIELHTDDKDRTGIVNNAKKNGVGVICSHHDIKQTPSHNEIVKYYDEIAATGAHLAKLVFRANTRDDVHKILETTKEMNKKEKMTLFTLFAMGEIGQPSRLLCPILGSCMTYCAIEPDPYSPLGQLSLKTTKRFFNLIERTKGWSEIRKQGVTDDLMKLVAIEFQTIQNYVQ